MSTVATRGFIQLCTVGSGIILARMLGPDGRGILGAAILWPVLFTYVGLFGLSEAITRAAAREKRIGPLARTAILLGLVASTLTVLIGYLVLGHLIPEDKVDVVLPLAAVALVLIPAEQFVLILGGIVQGRGNFRVLNACLACRSLLYVLLLLAGWLGGIQTVRWCIVAMLVPGIVVTAFYLGKAAPSVVAARGWYSPRRLLAGAWQFGVAIVGREFYQVVDKALLLWLVTEAEMGFYLAAFAAAGVVQNLIGSVGTVGFTECAKSPPRRGFPLVAGLFRKAVALWLLVGVALGVLMPFVLPLVYGSRFAPAVPVAVVLLLGIGALGITGMLNMCMFGQGRPLLGLVGRALGAALLVAVGLPLARYGAVGIAVANVAAQWACMLSLVILVCRHYEDCDRSLLVPRWADVAAIGVLVPRVCRRLFFRHDRPPDDDRR